MTLRGSILLPALGLVWCAAPCVAQTVGGGLGAGYVWRASDPGPGSMRGPAFSASIGAGIGWVDLDLDYVQGRLNTAGGAAATDLVEGSARLALRPVPWVGVEVGPHIRSYRSQTVTERWILWEGRLALHARLAGPALTSYVSVWRVLGGSVNVSAPMDAGQGMEGGLAWRIPASPLWMRAAYRAERVGFGDGARVETVEGLALAIGVGR